MRYWLVMPAAGVGSRFGERVPKQYASLRGRTVIEWALAPFLSDGRCVGAAVALASGDTWWPKVAERIPAVTVCQGGGERSESVRNALLALNRRAGKDDWVLVHDAARPCLPAADLDRLLTQASAHAVGGILALPVADTLKRALRPDGVPNAAASAVAPSSPPVAASPGTSPYGSAATSPGATAPGSAAVPPGASAPGSATTPRGTSAPGSATTPRGTSAPGSATTPAGATAQPRAAAAAATQKSSAQPRAPAGAAAPPAAASASARKGAAASKAAPAAGAPAIEVTVDRAGLWRASTPQMFRYGLLLAALESALAGKRFPTDEAQALEWQGLQPLLIEGSAANIKVTTPADLALAANLLAAREAK